MAENTLSAREAALIAQARAELEKRPAAPADATASAPVEPARAAAAIESAAPKAVEPVAPDAIKHLGPSGAAPVPALDTAERIGALMAAARTETERLRRRQRQLYVWTPVAFMSVIGLWTLLWMWHRL
jgi:hypothetical protein